MMGTMTGMHPSVRALQHFWPCFGAALRVYAQSDDMVEKICKSYKVVIRSAGATAFTVCLNELASLLLVHFRANQRPAFLYITSVLLQEFANSPEYDIQNCGCFVN
jgi:hypothetical protein